jgi:hypothetical protein
VAVAILASFFFFAFAMVQKPMLHAPLDVVKVCPAPCHPPPSRTASGPFPSSSYYHPRPPCLPPPPPLPVPVGPWLRLPNPASGGDAGHRRVRGLPGDARHAARQDRHVRTRPRR